MKRQKLLTALAELWDWNTPEIGDLFPSDLNREGGELPNPVYEDVTQELAFFHFGLETSDLLICQDDDDDFEDDFDDDDYEDDDMDFDDDDFDDEDDLEWENADDEDDFDMDDFDIDDDEFDDDEEAFDDED